MVENKNIINDTLENLKVIREKMKVQLEEYFQELNANPAPKRRQKLDSKVAMMRESLADNFKMIEREQIKNNKKQRM